MLSSSDDAKKVVPDLVRLLSSMQQAAEVQGQNQIYTYKVNGLMSNSFDILLKGWQCSLVAVRS